jgi:hypothetical protein
MGVRLARAQCVQSMGRKHADAREEQERNNDIHDATCFVWRPRRGNVSGVFRPLPKMVSREPPGRQRQQSQQGRSTANCADTPKTTPVGTAPALKWGTPGPPALEASAPGWVLGASDREQRVDVSERAEFPANAICSRLSGAGQTNQGSVIIVSSRHSRMGFFHDNCQGQDLEHRSVVGFSREIGVFRRPFQKGSDRDRTEQPRMARREVAWVHTRRAATEPADPTGPGRAGADLPANA